MGFFHFKKSKQEKSSQAEMDQLWNEAYQANPKVYENKDTGGALVAFALTEDTVSAFPISPEAQWAISGKSIDLWMISIVSLTTNSVIGQIEYHEAMKRLQPYIIASRENWALIRAMTHSELGGLFEGLPRRLI
jgi:hypothetical protein